MKTPKLLITLFFSVIVVLLAFTASAQQTRGTIRGQVVTVEHKPAENVSVVLKDTRYGTLSDENGNYSFRVPAGTYTLVISHVGAQSQQVQVTVQAGRSVKVEDLIFNISVNSLHEVTVSDDKTNKFVKRSSDYVSKMPLSNLENPQVYTTVSKELLQEQGLFSADDAIKNSPGITQLWTANGRAGDGGSYFALRGFSVQTTMRNGMSGIVTNTIDAANLEKLEVIKGPSGTLYGSSLISYGGLINRVTKKPFENTAGEVSFTTGSYNLNRVSVDYNTPLDADKKVLFRINSAYNNTNAFQDNGFAKTFAFDPTLSYKINDRLTLSLEAEISKGSGTTPVLYFFNTTVPDLGVNRADQLSLNYKRAYQSDDIVSNSNNENFFAQADYKISDSWRSQTNISTTNSGASGYQAYFYLLPGNDSISRNVWSVSGNSNTLQIQQNFIGDFKIGRLRNRLVAGVDFLSETSNVKYIDPNYGSDYFDAINTKGPIANYGNFNKAKVDSLFSNTPVVTYLSRYQNYTYSAFASDVLNITDNLLAMLSLRVNHFITEPVDDPTTNDPGKGFNQTTLSPKLGLVYQLIKDKVSVFGNYMNGFSSPGYNTVFDPGTGLNTTKLFKAEQANQFEGGVKLDLFNGKLSSTISYYDISVKNKIRPDANHANASVQDGTQKSKGFEAEVISNPAPGLNIILGYSHNSSLMEKSSDYDNGYRPEGSGPANSGNFWLSYTLTQGSAKGLGVGFGGNYAGDTPVINNSYSGTFILPEYTVFNSGVFFNKQKYRFAINVNNLTDKQYYTGYTTVNPQILRQIIGSFSYRF